LAGGGTRKKGPSSFGASTVRAAANLLQPHKSGSQRKMIAGQHLPEVEKKRREPWRIFRRESNVTILLLILLITKIILRVKTIILLCLFAHLMNHLVR